MYGKYSLGLLVLLLVLCPISSRAQKRSVWSKITSLSGYGSLNATFVPLSGRVYAFSGVDGACVLNQRFFVGGFQFNQENGLQQRVGPDEQEVSLYASTAGLFTGYVFHPSKTIHLGVGGRIGWGDFAALSLAGRQKIRTLQPQADLYFKVAKWYRVSCFVGYQWVTPTRASVYNTNELQGALFGLSLQFGWFEE